MNKQPHCIRRIGVLMILVLGLFYFGFSDKDFSAAARPCCQNCPTYQGCNDSCGSDQSCLDFCYNAVDRCETICVVC